jgi:hypothetical protein
LSIEEYVSGLERVEGISYPTYCSAGAQVRALKLSRIAEKGYAFFNSFIPTSHEVPLLVLNEWDWRRYFNDPYGMMVGDKGCIHSQPTRSHPQ